MTTKQEQRYDVIAVDRRTNQVRGLAVECGERGADQVLTVARLNPTIAGVEDVIVVATGTYQDGDQWGGHKATTEAF